MPAVPPKILLALVGLDIEGGIASVSRCVARALDAAAVRGNVERVDRVLLLDESAPAPPARGKQHLAGKSRVRFVMQLRRAYARHGHGLVLFDLVGLARSVRLPVPSFSRMRYCVFVHGAELDDLSRGRGRALQGAWRILANSAFTAGRLRRELPDVADRVHVVRLCIDPARIRLWESANGQPERIEGVVLIVARMASGERYKGHDQLIEAWPAVRRVVSSAELWIVGGGDDRARLAYKAGRLGAGSVRFLGRVPDDELGGLYRRASLFAMPSRGEGFGLVYAEAMWHGLPCIASTADAAGEVVVDGETGLLVRHGDVAGLATAVTDLLADPARRRRMEEAAHRHARERFVYARFEQDLLDALEVERGIRRHGV